MKRIITISTLALAALASQAAEIIAGSFNLLGTYKQDDEFSKERLELAARLVDYHGFDILGTQETCFWQTQGLLKSGIYACVGVNVKGEVPAAANSWTNNIFYKKDRFEVLESGAFFLSPTPDTPSKAEEWGEKGFRNCNWAKFKDKVSGKEFFFFNTHFGLTPKARLNSAKLFVQKIAEIAKGATFLAAGDYNILWREYATINALTKSKLLFDSWKISKKPPYGPEGTWIEMLYNRRINGSRWVENPELKLDFIFVSKDVKIRKCAVITDNIGGAYPSDHLPIEAYAEF